MKKVQIYTTLSLLEKAYACAGGMKTLMKSLGKKALNKKGQINLLHILKSNGISHFFWAWRATTKKHLLTKRKILHDIVLLVQPIYETKYPDNPCIKNVLKALRTGRNLQGAADAAYSAAGNAVVNASYAAYAANPAYDAVSAAATAAAYAAEAAFTAGKAAYSAYYATAYAAVGAAVGAAAKAASTAAKTAYAASYAAAKAAVYAVNAAGNAAYAAAYSSSVAYDEQEKMNQAIKEVIYKHLK